MVARSLVQACNRVINGKSKEEIEPKELAVIDEKPMEVVRSEGFELGQIEGEIGVMDIQFPRLNIAQAISEYAQKNKFDTGSLILKKEILLCAPGEELNFIVARLKLYYEQQTDKYNPEVPLQRFDKLADVAAAGLSLSAGTARSVADIFMLIECPKPCLSANFPILIGGKAYALAVWTVRKSSFRRAARAILTESAFSKRSLLAPKWKLVVQVEKLGQIMAGVPSVSVVGLNTPEELEAITTALQPS